MSERIFKVLLIEDDPMIQEVNKQFVESVRGFVVGGVASTGVEGMELLKSLKPDLVILDIFMPLQDGLETLAQIRREQLAVDVMVISAANDQQTISRMLQNGAVDYVIKPFKFERVKQALEHYRGMKAALRSDGAVSQDELDRLLFGLGAPNPAAAKPNPYPVIPEAALEQLPKGLQAITLKQITAYLLDHSEPLSAEEVAEGVGIARVTARRYLDHLVKSGKVRLDLQYGIGRPVNKYVITSKL